MQVTDEGMADIVRLVGRVRGFVARMAHIPSELLERAYRDSSDIGPRSLYWILAALRELDRHGRPFNKPATSKRKLHAMINAVGKRVCSQKRILRESPFWRVSAIQAMNSLGDLLGADQKPHPKWAKKITKILLGNLRQYAKGKKIFPDMDPRNMKTPGNLESGFQFYQHYWLWKATANAATDSPPVVPIRLRVAALSHLTKQLAMYAASAPSSNHMILCMASVLAYDCFRERSLKDQQVEPLIRQTLQIALSKNRRSFERRLACNLKNYGDFFTLPWEELLILCDIDTGWMPEDLSIIDAVIDFLEARMVYSGDQPIGLIEEGHPKFPAPAPYFSAYAIALCLRLIRMMRGKLRAMLIMKTSRDDPSALEDGVSYSDPVIESQEKVFKRLKKSFFPKGRVNLRALRDKNTVLLFGPPGTGKSTLLKWLVKSLNGGARPLGTKGNKSKATNWIAITLTPSNFLIHDSFSEILRSVHLVFSVVAEVDRCVIFFDEAEELLRERVEAEERFGRMFTAAVFLSLSRLQKNGSLYVFATNFIDKMDSAAIRKGRFAIRKGMGWISNDKPTIKTIKKKYFTSLKQTDVKKITPYRSVAELRDISTALSATGTTRNAAKAVSDILTKWKSYISPKDVCSHIINCLLYDDDWSQKDFDIEIAAAENSLGPLGWRDLLIRRRERT